MSRETPIISLLNYDKEKFKRFIENPHPRKWTETEIATVQKLFDIIQKHKQ